MKLRQIEIFLALARTPNMRAVAARLYLSQAGVSSALREMEGELGVPLFDRFGRGLRLNEKGRLLFSNLAPLYRQLNDCLDLVMSGAMVGDVRLGASTTLADYVLPQILYDFKKRHDRVRIAFESASTKEIVLRVEDGSLDVGFVEGEVTNLSVKTAPLGQEDLVVVTADAALARSGPHPLAELMRGNWLVRREGSGTRETFLNQVMRQGLSPNVFLECGNNDAIKKLLRNPGTLACISPLVVEEDMAAGRLLEVAVRDATFSRTFLQVLHRDRPLTPLLKSLSQAVAQALTP